MILNIDNNLILFFLIIVIILLIFFVCLKKSNVNNINKNTKTENFKFISEGFYNEDKDEDEHILKNKNVKQIMLYQDNGIFYYIGLFEDKYEKSKTSIYIISNLKLNNWEFIELKDSEDNTINNIKSISLNHNGEILFITDDRIYCKSNNTDQISHNIWILSNWYIYDISGTQPIFIYVMFYKSFIENNNIINKYLILTNQDKNNLFIANCVKNKDQFHFDKEFNVNIQDKKILKISRDLNGHLLALTNDYKLIKSKTTTVDIDKDIKEKKVDTIVINFKSDPETKKILHNENILYDYIYDQDGRLFGIGEVDGNKQILKQEISNYLSPFINLSKLYSIEKNKIKISKNDIIYFNNGYKKGLHIIIPQTLEDAHYLQRKNDISEFREFCKMRHPTNTYIKNEQIEKFAEKIKQLQEVKNELLKTKTNGVPIN